MTRTAYVVDAAEWRRAAPEFAGDAAHLFRVHNAIAPEGCVLVGWFMDWHDGSSSFVKKGERITHMMRPVDMRPVFAPPRA